MSRGVSESGNISGPMFHYWAKYVDVKGHPPTKVAFRQTTPLEVLQRISRERGCSAYYRSPRAGCRERELRSIRYQDAQSAGFQKPKRPPARSLFPLSPDRFRKVVIDSQGRCLSVYTRVPVRTLLPAACSPVRPSSSSGDWGGSL